MKFSVNFGDCRWLYPLSMIQNYRVINTTCVTFRLNFRSWLFWYRSSAQRERKIKETWEFFICIEMRHCFDNEKVI